MLEDTDISILKLLQQNSRRSYRDMAKDLGISINTVSSRIKRMEKEGIIRGYTVLADPVKAGFDMTAVIGIQISRGKLMDVQRRIADDKHVCAVYDVTGEWDSLIIARFRGRNELNTFIKKILTMEYVERTLTQVVLNSVKEESSLPL